METQNTPLVHPVPEACRRLSIGRTMLYQLIERGELRPIKLGSKTLIPEAELQRLVAERLSAGGAE